MGVERNDHGDRPLIHPVHSHGQWAAAEAEGALAGARDALAARDAELSAALAAADALQEQLDQACATQAQQASTIAALQAELAALEQSAASGGLSPCMS